MLLALATFRDRSRVFIEFPLATRIGDTITLKGVEDPVNLLLVLGLLLLLLLFLLLLRCILRIDDGQNILVLEFVLQVFFVRLVATVLFFYFLLLFFLGVLGLPFLDLPR